MRMINLLAVALARVLFLKKSKEYPEALIEIDKVTKKMLGAGRDILQRCTDEELIQLFGSDRTLASSKFYVLGVLLKEEADIELLQGNIDEGIPLSLKSLRLLLESFTAFGRLMDVNHSRHIDEVLQQLHSTDFPPHIANDLFSYYECVGRFDKAENTLFDLLETNENFIDTGIGFYERLLAKTDSELRQGNLPKEEVEEGLAELEKMKQQRKTTAH